MAWRSEATRWAAAGLLVLVACSSTDDANPIPTPDDNSAVDGEAVVSLSPTATGRYGSGQARAADVDGDVAVVATSIGAQLRTGDRFSALETSLEGSARDVWVTPSGEAGALFGDEGTFEIWSLGPEPALRRTVGGALAVSVHETAAVIATRSSISMVSLVDGSDLDSVAVDAGRVVTSVVAGAGWWFATVAGEAGTQGLLVVDGRDPSVVPLPVDFESRVVRSITDPTGAHLALGVQDGASSDVARVVIVDPMSGDVSGMTEVASLAAAPNWAIGTDGRVLIGDGSTVRSVASDGSESSEDAGAFDEVVTWVRATPGGQWLVFQRDGEGWLVDERGATVTQLVGTGRAIHALDSGIGGDELTAVDSAGIVTVWSMTGDLVERFDGFSAGEVRDVTISADDRVAASWSDGSVIVSDRSLAEDAVIEFGHPEGNVDSVAFSPDGGTIVTGVSERRGPIAFDDTVSIWPVAGGERLHTHGGDVEDVAGCSFFRNVVAFAADGSVVAATSHDFTVSLLDPASGNLLHTFPPHGNTVLDVAVSPSGRLLASSSDDSSMRIWDVASRELVADYATPMGGYWSMRFLDEETLVVGDVTGQVALVDPATGQADLTFSSSKARQAEIDVSSDGLFVAAGADGDIVRIWSVASGDVVADLAGHAGAVTTAEFTTDGRQLVSGSVDGTLILWDLV